MLPFMGKHYVSKAEHKVASDQIVALNHKICMLKDELHDSKKVIAKVLPKLMNIKVYDYDPYYRTRRICVDIHEDVIQRAFEQGDSDREIRLFARLLAEMVERKMVQFNFLWKEGR